VKRNVFQYLARTKLLSSLIEVNPVSPTLSQKMRLLSQCTSPIFSLQPEKKCTKADSGFSRSTSDKIRGLTWERREVLDWIWMERTKRGRK
jgi:hypothetical protein